jgi:hypothetical protein
LQRFSPPASSHSAKPKAAQLRRPAAAKSQSGFAACDPCSPIPNSSRPGTQKHTQALAPHCLLQSCPWLAALRLECPEVSHSNNSQAAFSILVPNKCLISNSIQMPLAPRRMRARPARLPCDGLIPLAIATQSVAVLCSSLKSLIASPTGFTRERNFLPSPSVVDSEALLHCLLIAAGEGSVHD